MRGACGTAEQSITSEMKSEKKGFLRTARVGQQLVPLMPPMRRYSLLRENYRF
jgi:hypothetical protein